MLAAYYCFTNLGWPPSQFASLPYYERRLVTLFVFRDLISRKRAEDKAKSNVKG
nr:MAG TPA: hypothetical protein [Caudoviricetes sp.]